MSPANALVSVSVHVGGDTRMRLGRTQRGDQVWLEIGETDGAVALFLDGSALSRMVGLLHEADSLLAAA